MKPKEFTNLQSSFLEYDGVCILGGCCGTTPEHIKELTNRVQDIVPKPPIGSSS